MKILGLYNNDCALDLFNRITEKGHEVRLCNERLDPDWCKAEGFDLTVSYTYRYILSESDLAVLGYNVVNLHNSFLPWNRGADPNLWSLIDNTPRGVTLHYMDSKLDKGYVIAQDIVTDGNDETLYSSYMNLDRAAKELFMRAFNYYDLWPSMKKKTIGEGSYHSLKDGERIKKIIDTYDMPVADFVRRVNSLNHKD